MRTILDEILAEEYSTFQGYKLLETKGIGQNFETGDIKSALTYDRLNKIWNTYRGRAPEDCVQSCDYVARKIGILFNKSTPMGNPIKKFKYGIHRATLEEVKAATIRYRKGIKDTLGDALTIYRGESALNPEKFQLRPGMLVYTAENAQWCDTSKKTICWGMRHMRMYIGNGEFRDRGDYPGSRKGLPVWGRRGNVYVVLAVYDPFSSVR